MTNKQSFDIIKTVKEDIQRKEIDKMKKELNEMNRKYYNAVAVKDWKTAKELLDKITKLQNEMIFGYYEGLKKA